MLSILLKNGNVIDPSSRFEGKADLLIKNGVIAEIGESLDATADKVIDCEGLCVIPGICDMHVHLRDPGQTHKEDIITGCEAAAAGGVKTVQLREKNLSGRELTLLAEQFRRKCVQSP